jgi:NAD(P)-dependent dehydrogenase (short-subunit alcohol dehydrogenase family)
MRLLRTCGDCADLRKYRDELRKCLSNEGVRVPESEAVFASYPSLAGRTAFVSGGASGLGAEFVEQLAGQGTAVGFVDVDESRGQALERRLLDAGAVARFVPCDVRDIPALQGAIAEIAASLGPIRVLVNNAANDHRDRVADMDVALWDDRIAVNVRHHFFAAQAVAEGMRDAGGGSIVNLGSISAHIDLMDLPGYITAKAGVEGLTRTLAREYGPWGIRVNCIIPGWIMTEKQLTEWVTPEAEQSIARNQCLPQKLVPADVARMLLWLAADDSRSCTAQQWVVDGGWM